MWKKIALLIVTVVVGLAIAEATVRALELAPSFGATREGQHAPSPDAELVWVNSKGGLDHNSLGMRGPEPDSPKSRPRVLLLGDSIAYGFGLPLEDSIATRAELFLGKLGVEVEVLNGGTCGYDTKQEARLLEKLGPDLDLDMVVVVYCLNDVRSRGGPNERMVRDATKRGQEADWNAALAAHTMSPFERFWMTNSHVARLALLLRQSEALEVTQETKSKLSGEGLDVSIVEAGLGRIAGFCNEEGVRRSVAIMPWIGSVERKYPYADHHEIVGQLAETLGFGVVDLYEPFLEGRGRSGKTMHRENDPVHPDRAGAILAARVIAEHVAARLAEK